MTQYLTMQIQTTAFTSQSSISTHLHYISSVIEAVLINRLLRLLRHTHVAGKDVTPTEDQLSTAVNDLGHRTGKGTSACSNLPRIPGI